MDTLGILIEARRLIDLPSHWTQGHFAKCLDGGPINPLDGRAVCFCADGALRNVACKSEWQSYGAAFEALAAQCGTDPISFNDTHTHAEVLAAFDSAIAAAR